VCAVGVWMGGCVCISIYIYIYRVNLSCFLLAGRQRKLDQAQVVAGGATAAEPFGSNDRSPFGADPAAGKSYIYMYMNMYMYIYLFIYIYIYIYICICI